MAENDLAPSHGQVIELTQDLQADFQDSQVMQDNSMTVLFKESHLGILVLTIKDLLTTTFLYIILFAHQYTGSCNHRSREEEGGAQEVEEVRCQV